MAEGRTWPEYRKCIHGYHHPEWPHSCDGCWCEGERDRREYGWDHNTAPHDTPEIHDNLTGNAQSDSV